jgi:hypothetical protein
VMLLKVPGSNLDHNGPSSILVSESLGLVS